MLQRSSQSLHGVVLKVPDQDLGNSGSKPRLCHGHFVGDSRPVTHRVVMKIKQRRGELYMLLWDSTKEKGVV